MRKGKSSNQIKGQRRRDRQECLSYKYCPPDTTTPHRVNCMARWGEKTGKLRVQIIVGSGAYAHRYTVESRGSGLCSCLVPKYQEMTSTAFLILFSSAASLVGQKPPVKNQLDCSRSVQTRRLDRHSACRSGAESLLRG